MIHVVSRARPHPGRPLLRALLRRARRFPRLSVLLLALVLMVGDFVTGVGLAFTLFYLAPVALAVWWRGRSFACVIAALCTGTSVFVELWSGVYRDWHVHPLNMVWNHGGSLLVYITVALLVERVRVAYDKDEKDRRIAVEQLRQAERLGVVGKLAAGIAHELGTPLHVIVGYAELIDSDLATRTNISQASRVILAQADKMTTIIRGLLDFSRPASGDKSDVDLGVLANSAKTVLQPMAQKKGVRIEVEVTGDERALALGNAVELEQVLVNLMVNGIQAMPKGGVLRVHVRPRVRDPGAKASLPQVACLEVEDEGIGISHEALPKIFDPFFTTKGVGEGTGLGLSVSYGIVADHSGRIQVSSDPGVGSRFSVYLPRAAPP